MVRPAERLALLRPDTARGQHHLDRASGTDDAAHPRARPAAREDAEPNLGQLIERRRLGDADMGRGRDLEPAAEHHPGHRRDHGNRAELDLLRRPVPGTRHRLRLGCAHDLELGDVETGAEVIAGAGQHHDPDAVGGCREEAFDGGDQRGVDGVPLVRTVEREDGNAIGHVDGKG